MVYETIYMKPKVCFCDKNGGNRCLGFLRGKKNGLLHFFENPVKLNNLNEFLEREALFFFDFFEKLFLKFTIFSHSVRTPFI